MSTLAAAPESAGAPDPASTPSRPAESRPGLTNVILAVCLAAVLLVVAFVTSGGVDQTSATSGNTWTEIALTLLGAGAVGTAALGAGRARGRMWGMGTVALMAAFTALTALSIIWSVAPDSSWSAADQLLGYLGAFAGAVALARLMPGRWPVLLGAIALTTTALAGWALLAKVFPATLAADNTVGRLQAPFGYWNALGVIAALGLPACLWAGARREHGRRLAVLTAPAIALLIGAIVLSASRSADAVAIIGVALWLIFVPQRLRSVALLATGALGGVLISAWGVAHSQLTRDGSLTHAMDSAGHTFGIVVAGALLLTIVAGAATVTATDHVTVSPALRRRIGTVLIVLACVPPAAAVGALAASSEGLGGHISHAWTTLTSTKAAVSNTPGRVFDFGSSRPLYWHQGLDVGSHALLKGVGASGYGIARLRYTTLPYKSDQAHSYLVETFADLGLVGIVLTLTLLAAWCRAAARPLRGPRSWSSLPDEMRAEREGMAALAIIVVGFGIQSALDWTWYFPGVVVPVLLAAGWLAGRGPLAEPIGFMRVGRSLLDRPAAVAVAAVAAVIALAGAWVQWQPQRSANQLAVAENAATNAEAFAQARAASSSDPLAVEPHFFLSSLYEAVKDIPAARAQMQDAVRIQPDNPLVWSRLGSLEFQTGRPAQTIAALRHLLAIDHTSDPFTRIAMPTIQLAQSQLKSQQQARAAGQAPDQASKPAARRAAGAGKPR